MICRLYSLFSIGLLGLGGCSGLGAASWETSVEDDAMTSKRTSTALTKLAGDTFDAEVKIVCVDGARATYSVTTFDKSGETAPLRGEENSQWGLQYHYGLRQDDLPSRIFRVTFPKYNNQIAFASDRTPGSFATADKLTVRAFLLSGEETYVIDQTDGAVRSVLSACVDTPDQIAAVEAEKARQDQEREAERAREDAERAAQQQEEDRLAQERQAAEAAHFAEWEVQNRTDQSQSNWTDDTVK